jgi:hypothetical protein
MQIRPTGAAVSQVARSPGSGAFIIAGYLQSLFEANLADQANGGQGSAIVGPKCMPMGMPYQMNGFSPFELLVSPAATHMLFEFSSYLKPRWR